MRSLSQRDTRRPTRISSPLFEEKRSGNAEKRERAMRRAREWATPPNRQCAFRLIAPSSLSEARLSMLRASILKLSHLSELGVSASQPLVLAHVAHRPERFGERLAQKLRALIWVYVSAASRLGHDLIYQAVLKQIRSIQF